jgi:EAL domain-containing protein (putative c-di-GMP-specific phosphodiesterase class I)
VKLDRSFLGQLSGKNEAQRVIQSLILLAEHLKLDVVAEGIETRSQLDAVRSLRCPFGQGFYFSRPAPPGREPIQPLNDQGPYVEKQEPHVEKIGT